MFAEIIQQVEQSERLVARAQKLTENVRGLRSGDRVMTPIIASAEFPQGAAPSANLVFNVPADADFRAYRLLLYPYCKVVDPVNATGDEVAFRPTSFSGEAMSTGVPASATNVYSDFNTLVDGRFALVFQGKEIQNIDTPMSAAYGANIGKWASTGGSPWAAASQSPGGHVFDIPFFIQRSKSLVCRVTPVHLGVRTLVESILPGPVNITRQHRYKIVGVLEGEKRVAAFR